MLFYVCGVSIDFKRTLETFIIFVIIFIRDHILKVHNLRKHTDISDMKYRCSICPYATIENAALKKHIRFKHTHDVRNPFIFKSKAPLTNMNLYCLISETIFMQYLWIQYTYSKYYEKTQARYYTHREVCSP